MEIFGYLPGSVNLLSPASKARMLADSYVVVVPGYGPIAPD
jgi:hypothetical protein